MAKMAKMPKMAKDGPEWSRMAQDGRFEALGEASEALGGALEGPRMAQDCPGWPRMAQDGQGWPRMAKDGPGWPKMAQDG